MLLGDQASWVASGHQGAPLGAHFFSILEASGLRDVHFTIVKCKNPKMDNFFKEFLQTLNMVKIKLSCRREPRFHFLGSEKSKVFARDDFHELGLWCRRELDFQYLRKNEVKTK